MGITKVTLSISKGLIDMQFDFFLEHEDLVTDENGKVCSKCEEYLPLSDFSPCSGVSLVIQKWHRYERN